MMERARSKLVFEAFDLRGDECHCNDAHLAVQSLGDLVPVGPRPQRDLVNGRCRVEQLGMTLNEFAVFASMSGLDGQA
jgi:hypothetical protein